MQSLRLLSIMTVLAGALAAPVQAQDYPSKPIKIVVPVAAGGSTDVVARVVAAYLARKTNQPVIVENRTGAAGTIGTDAVAKAPADGYTLGLNANSQIVLNPFVQKNMPLDPLSDLVPIAPIAEAPQLLVINARIPATTLQDFIAYAKQHPNQLNYVSLGPGSMTYLGSDQFVRRAKVDIVPVQYRGVAPGLMDLIVGNVQMISVGFAPIAHFVEEGTLRALAAQTAKRLPYLPNVPTVAEVGLPGYEMSTWFGLFAPRGTPQSIVEQLNRYARELVADPATVKHLTNIYL